MKPPPNGRHGSRRCWVLLDTWNLFPAGKGFFFDKRRWRREIWLRCSPTLAGRNYKTASRTLQIPSGKLQSTNPLRRNGYSHLITKLQNYIANAQVYNEHLALPPSLPVCLIKKNYFLKNKMQFCNFVIPGRNPLCRKPFMDYKEITFL